MIRRNLFLIAACSVPLAAPMAETATYRAELLPHGSVELVPVPDGEAASARGDRASGETILTFGEPVETGDDATAYVVTDPRGRQTIVPTLDNLRLAAGTTVKVVAMGDGYPAGSLGLSPQLLRETARTAAVALLLEARTAVCSLNPRPRTIKPTTTVSLPALRITIEAEWETSEACEADATSPDSQPPQ